MRKLIYCVLFLAINISGIGAEKYYMLADSIPDKVSEMYQGSEPLDAIMVEAESFQAMRGITTEICSDTDGGENITFSHKGDWAEYSLDMAADYYDFKFRVASPGENYKFSEHDTLRILTDGKIIGHVVVKSTGGPDVWETLTIPVNIETAGTKTIRLEMISNVDSVKLNWFDYTQLSLAESELAFNTYGRATTFKLNGSDLLAHFSFSKGFTMYSYDGKTLNSTTSVTGSTSGNMYTFTSDSLKFTFRIDTYPRHISLHLVKVEGVGENRNFGLQLVLLSGEDLACKTLSDLVTASYRSSTYQLTLNWPYLYAQEGDGYRGGVVIYKDGSEGYELDKILAEIWTTEEQMPKHAGQPSWTSSDVLNWVDNYASRFNNLSVLNLQPESNEELYSMVENIAIPGKFKRIYLHCATWRGEYWLYDYQLTHVNTQIFPKGEEDLKAFVDYLHDLGMTIQLHNVSLGVGKNNPVYIKDHVDRRLASWGTGTLEEPVNASQKRILFRPDSSCAIPLVSSVHTDDKQDYTYMRLGEELIKVGSFTRTEKDVWVLQNCTRSFGINPAVSHPTGEEMAGLYTGFSKNFVPEFDMGQENSLADELITEYAGFINEMGVDHIHFDGHKLHNIYSNWSWRPITSGVYAKTNRPVTTSRVGSTIPANWELEFSQTKDVDSYNYWSLDVGVRLNSANKLYYATNILGTHWLIQENLMLGARRVQFSGINHADGITYNLMENHGLVDTVVSLTAHLQNIVYEIDDADLKYISDQMVKVGTHYQSEDVFVLGINENDKYIWTPYHVMGLSDGSTPMWYNDQENGAIDRNQVITNGETMELTNPKASQDLSFYIHNIDANKNLTDPTITLSNGGYIEIIGTINPEEYLGFSADSTSAIRYNEDWKPLETLETTVSNFAVPQGKISITVGGSGGATSLTTQFYVKGEPYVLKTNDKL